MKKTMLIALSAVIIGCGEPKQGKELESRSEVPTWEPIERITDAHLRGLNVTDDGTVWASGTKGTVLIKATNEEWKDVSIPQAIDHDLRDIHGFDRFNAVALTAGNGVRIYRSYDAGKSWQTVYEDADSALFYDGLDFLKDGFGAAYGDPQDGRLSLLTSSDSGNSWIKPTTALLPELDSNEAGYAASGTGIIVTDQEILVATGGGPVSRLLRMTHSGEELQSDVVPLSSSPGSGIFSMCKTSSGQLIAVGGSYLDSNDAHSNCAVLHPGHDWLAITVKNPKGYRSCVAAHPQDDLTIAVGRTGSDYSNDGGLTWESMGTEGYFSCQLSAGTGWAVGRNGKMAQLTWKRMNQSKRAGQ